MRTLPAGSPGHGCRPMSHVQGGLELARVDPDDPPAGPRAGTGPGCPSQPQLHQGLPPVFVAPQQLRISQGYKKLTLVDTPAKSIFRNQTSADRKAMTGTAASISNRDLDLEPYGRSAAARTYGRKGFARLQPETILRCSGGLLSRLPRTIDGGDKVFSTLVFHVGSWEEQCCATALLPCLFWRRFRLWPNSDRETRSWPLPIAALQQVRPANGWTATTAPLSLCAGNWDCHRRRSRKLN